MAGFDVSRALLDQRAGETLLSLRDVLERVAAIAAFLANNPVRDGVDPLSDPEGEFQYTEDEAYLLRYLFESLHNLPLDNLMHDARKLTGLS